MNVLDRIVGTTREEVARRRGAVPLQRLEALLGERPEARPIQEALTRPGISLIAEHKRRSPSAGAIREGATVAEVVQAYERGCAAALSILTEPFHFGGSLDDLREARAATSLPVLRKDFIVDPYQLYESAAVGADAILLIVAALEQARLVALQRHAGELGLAALVEVHDDGELARAVDAGARLIGVNNRNLRTLSVDTDASYRLAALMPAGVTPVSESGLKTRAELERLAAAGYRAFLIGERFMTDPDPARAIAALIGMPEGGPGRSDDVGAAFGQPGSR